MTSLESRLAALFLEMASDHLANHSCNDWEWPEWFPQANKEAFLRAMEEHNSGNGYSKKADTIVEMYSDEYGPPDWWMMSYLASLLEPKEQK